MTVQGNPRNYDKRFLFSVEIDDIDVAWFSSISGLEAEIGVVEQHEGGGINVADESPGKVKFSELTLGVGSTDNRQMYDWWLQVVDASGGDNGSGLPDDQYKKNIAIVQRDRDGTTKRRWNLFQAWPKKFKAGEWDATAEENVMQEVVIRYRRFDLAQ
jgi:phage tail-like protein